VSTRTNMLTTVKRNGTIENIENEEKRENQHLSTTWVKRQRFWFFWNDNH